MEELLTDVMPVSYTHLDVYKRQVYAKTKQAKALGFTDAYFSFNSKKGRCEHCEGMGTIKSHMRCV